MRNFSSISKSEIEKKKAAFAAEREANRKLQIEAYAKVKGISTQRAQLIFEKKIKPKD